MTAFVKLSQRLQGSELPRILAYIESQRASMDMELQQRACEFSTLLETQWDSLRPMALEQMPAMDEEKLKSKRAREGAVDEGAGNGTAADVDAIAAGAGGMSIAGTRTTAHASELDCTRALNSLSRPPRPPPFLLP